MVGRVERGARRGGSAWIESGFGLMTRRTGWRGGLWRLVLECTAAVGALLVAVVLRGCCVDALGDLQGLVLVLRVLGGIESGFA